MSSPDKKKGLFREKAYAKLASPEQIDKLLVVMTPKGWIALATLFAIIFAAIIWAFVGHIPIVVSGKGILLTRKGVFNVVSTARGVVVESPLKVGDSFTADTPLIRVKEGENIKEVNSLGPGKVLEIYVKAGDWVEKGSQIIWAGHLSDQNEQLLALSYFDVAAGEKIEEGMEAKIALENIDVGRFGYLLGEVKEVSSFPLSDKSMFTRIRNSDVIKLLKMGQPAVIQAEIALACDDSTPSGYKFTTKKGPPKDEVGPGKITDVRVTIDQKAPISYIFPAYSPRKKKIKVAAHRT